MRIHAHSMTRLNLYCNLDLSEVELINAVNQSIMPQGIQCHQINQELNLLSARHGTL